MYAPLNAFALLWLATAMLLLAFGLEDRRAREVHVYTMLGFTIVFAIAYAYFWTTSSDVAWIFLLVGWAIFFISWVSLRNQIKEADIYALFLSAISFPFIALPTVLATLGLSIISKEKHSPFCWHYAVAFIGVSMVEYLILAAWA